MHTIADQRPGAKFLPDLGFSVRGLSVRGLSALAVLAATMSIVGAAGAQDLGSQTLAPDASIESLDRANRTLEAMRLETEIERARIELLRAQRDLEILKTAPNVDQEAGDQQGGFDGDPRGGGQNGAPLSAPPGTGFPQGPGAQGPGALLGVDGLSVAGPVAPRVVAILGVAGELRAALLFPGNGRKTVARGERVDRYFKVGFIADDFVEFENVDTGDCVTMIVGADPDAAAQGQQTLPAACMATASIGSGGASDAHGAARSSSAVAGARNGGVNGFAEKDALPERF